MDPSSASIARDIWSSIPTEQLLSELSKRQHGGAAMDNGPKPQCGSTANAGSYNTALHVGAVFLILILSTGTCGLPLITNALAKSPRQKKFLFYCQHVGTGVLLATAFIHLLPMAFMALTNPCLPDFFSKRYTPMAGLVAMVAALCVVALESYLSSRGAGHVHSHALWDDDDGDGEKVPICHDDNSGGDGGTGESGLAARRRQHPAAMSLDDIEATEGLVEGISPRPGLTPTTQGPALTRTGVDDSDAESDMELALNELDPSPEDDPHRPLNGRAVSSRPAASQSATDSAPPSPETQKRMLIQVLLLEAGILFHSVFIGMALSVEANPTFLVLLFAISIHQSFEGLALGSRIAALHFPRTSLRPWLMVLVFGLSTPLGQVIGLGMHKLYDPQSEAGLLVVGLMDAISAGLLLFAGLVQLLAQDFLSEESYRVLQGGKRVKALGSVFFGALLMAAVRAIV